MPIFTSRARQPLGRGQAAERVGGQHALRAVRGHGRGDPARRARVVVDDRRARASVPPTSRIARARPAQRSSSPVLPTCWLMQIARRTPASASRRPASSPARSSSWPTCASTPSDLKTSLPELIETTGMPAVDRAADRRRQPALGDRDDEPVGLGRDRLVDQRAHALERVDVGRAVVDEHVEPARGGVDAVADDRPELARRRPVGDDRDPHRVVGQRRARRPAQPLGVPETWTPSSRTTVVPPQPASNEQRTAAAAASYRDPRAQPRAAADRAVDLQRPADRRHAVVEPAQAGAGARDRRRRRRRRRRATTQLAVRRAAPRRARSTRARSGRRWSAPRRRGSTRRPRPAPAAAPSTSTSHSIGTVPRSASAPIAGASPRSVRIAGWMPRASSRSSASAVASRSDSSSISGAAVRVLHARLEHPQLERERHELLLRAVVQVALDPPARGVAGLHDPQPRHAQLLHARLQVGLQALVVDRQRGRRGRRLDQLRGSCPATRRG